MLTPERIKNKSFTTTGMGSYRADDVDLFLKEVYTSYDQMFRENREIIKKMSILANKVEEYKKDEESLSQALISAQKLADQIVSDSKQTAKTNIDEANEKAEQIQAQARENANKLISDAKAEADAKVFAANKQSDEILGGINRKLTQEKLVYDMLHKEVSEFKDKMIEMYKEHFNLLDRLPEIANGKINAGSPEAQKILQDIKDGNFTEILSEESADEIAEIENVPYDDEKTPVEEIKEDAEQEASKEAEEIADVEVFEEESSDEELPEEEEREVDGFSLMDVDLDSDDDLDIDDIVSQYADADESDEEPAEEPEEEETEPASDDGFSLDLDSLDDDEFDDISSGDDDEFAVAEESSAEDDGFSIDFSNLELEDEEDNDKDSKRLDYASVDDEDEDEEDDDDDDEGAISFKRFFKKK